jgi:hypothetical protein
MWALPAPELPPKQTESLVHSLKEPYVKLEVDVKKPIRIGVINDSGSRLSARYKLIHVSRAKGRIVEPSGERCGLSLTALRQSVGPLSMNNALHSSPISFSL